MQRPLIAVSTDIDDLPTAFGNMDCARLNAEYTNAIYAAGGQPMILPVVAEPPTELLTQTRWTVCCSRDITQIVCTATTPLHLEWSVTSIAKTSGRVDSTASD